MKSRPNMENNRDVESGKRSPAGTGISRDKKDGDDTEDDDDEDRDEPVIVTTTVADSCSAAHEFEWLSPSSRGGVLYSHLDKQNERPLYSDLSAERQHTSYHEELGSPARSIHHRHHKLPVQVWPRRSADVGELRMSPSPCHEFHGCRRHASPIRSSWCCPSPTPHALCVHHHGANVLTGLELVPYNRECFGSELSFWPYQSCSCLPPSGLSAHSRYPESHGWCQNPSTHHEVLRRESSSPCAMHRPCQGPAGSRMSRSSSSCRRDCSPTLSPRSSPVQNDPSSAVRHSGHEQWQIPSHSDDISNMQKIQELESDKKNLILQASVLADQVEAQADKIAELERFLEQKKDELIRLEQNLHQEILAHSAIESSKLELMSELSNLRLRLTAAERDRKESDDKCRKLENELSLLQAGLFEQAEPAVLGGKAAWNGSHTSSSENSEIEKLRSALDSVMLSNKEKDRKIEDLLSSLSKYKKLQDMFLSIQMRKIVDPSRDNQMLDSDNIVSSINSDALRKLHFDSSFAKASQALSAVTSTSSIPSEVDHSVRSQCSAALYKNLSDICSSSAFHKSNSVENICPSSTIDLSSKNQYGTMPRQSGAQVLQQLQVRLKEHGTDEKAISLLSGKEQPEISVAIKGRNKSGRSPSKTGGKSSGVLFGKGFFKLRTGKRSSSEPHLAAQECVTIPTTEMENLVTVGDGATISSQSHLIKTEKDKTRGFLKFFSKWKRCGSQNIEKVEGEFKRGGVRATAGPRLGWSRDIHIDPGIPFSRWNVDMIVEWLHKLGLSMYISECKSWMCNGEMLLKATSHDIEKELNMRHPLHKKKILLAVKSINSASLDIPQALNNIDYLWVVRWLDDIGLPQYKDAFTEARVDGRVLHFLTVEDLLFLKVTSQLHHISIKRGIQLLREKCFDPHCLVRRSLPDEDKVYTPEMVALWSNHRVMEWLRTVDLSEYAPNLRGSGVHGALIVYEAKFNTNLFATLLNIPPTKTLLRRHLATHFKHIVGDELMQIKREKETEAPLSPSVKIKITRKPQFALKKKRNKSEFENDELVCPMDIPVCAEALKPSDCEKLVVRRNSDPSPQEQRHLDLKTMLHDENLSEAPTTIV